VGNSAQCYEYKYEYTCACVYVQALMGSDVAAQRGIYTDLINAYNLDSLLHVKSRADFVEALPTISSKSKDFFIFSSKYFDTAERGFVQLLGPLYKFSASKLVGGVELTIHVPQMSFSTWVRTDPIFVNGYLVRKRLVPAGYGSDLSCWGWYLDRHKGPQFHYGVHDVFPTDVGMRHTHLRQIEVSLPKPPTFQHTQYSLLTVIVTQTNITFWRNLEHLGTVGIERPVTDCFNDAEGVYYFWVASAFLASVICYCCLKGFDRYIL